MRFCKQHLTTASINYCCTLHKWHVCNPPCPGMEERKIRSGNIGVIIMYRLWKCLWIFHFFFFLFLKAFLGQTDKSHFVLRNILTESYLQEDQRPMLLGSTINYVYITHVVFFLLLCPNQHNDPSFFSPWWPATMSTVTPVRCKCTPARLLRRGRWHTEREEKHTEGNGQTRRNRQTDSKAGWDADRDRERETSREASRQTHTPWDKDKKIPHIFLFFFFFFVIWHWHSGQQPFWI